MEFLHGVRFLVPMKRRPVRLRYNMQRCGWSASVVDCIIVMQPPLPVLPRPSQASPTPLRFHASTPLRLYASTSPCLHVSTPPRLRASMLLHDCRLSCLHPRAILVSPISSDQSRRPYSHPCRPYVWRRPRARPSMLETQQLCCHACSRGTPARRRTQRTLSMYVRTSYRYE